MTLNDLNAQLAGELHTGDLMRRIYSTDASAYQELPLAVAVPANEADLSHLIAYANAQGVGLIPRTAGTSLAGQVVVSWIARSGLRPAPAVEGRRQVVTSDMLSVAVLSAAGAAAFSPSSAMALKKRAPFDLMG